MTIMTIRQNSFIAGEMISRKQMLDMGLPIGNPNLPPFNRREMPFAPLTGAFAAVGAASGFLATTAAVINLAAVAAMYVGVAMTVTGMVTGDKDLMKLGAIVGLAGGVTSMAIGGVASLAAGGEFAMGTAGIESMNAANAASASAEGLLTNAAAGVVAPNANTAINGMLGQGATQTAQTAGEVTAGMPLSSQAGGMSPLLGKEAVGAFSPAINNATGAVASGVNSTASGAINNLLAQGSTTGAGSGGFFTKLMSDMTPKDWIIAGGTVVSGGAKAVAANQANATAQKKFEYEQSIRNQQIQNLNTVPSLISAPSMA
jgi:hypothetical protein